MAVKYVDPNATVGGNGTSPDLGAGANRPYNSLTDWEAAIQGTFTEIQECFCQTNGGLAHTGQVTIDGSTTTASFYHDIKVVDGYRHSGTWDNTKFRITNSTTNAAISIADDFVRIHGIQVSLDNVAGLAINQAVLTAGGIRVVRTIVRATVAAQTFGIFILQGATSPQIVANNIVYGFSGVGAIGLYLRSGVTAGGRTVAYHNTVYGCTQGIRVRDTVNLIKNNLSIGSTDAYLMSDTADSGSTNNGYDEGTDPATAGVNLSAYADAAIFVNAAGADFHLVSGSPAIDVGVNLSADSDYALTLDCDGATRVAPYDIGADEYAAVAGNDITVFLQEPVIGGCVF